MVIKVGDSVICKKTYIRETKKTKETVFVAGKTYEISCVNQKGVHVYFQTFLLFFVV